MLRLPAAPGAGAARAPRAPSVRQAPSAQEASRRSAHPASWAPQLSLLARGQPLASANYPAPAAAASTWPSPARPRRPRLQPRQAVPPDAEQLQASSLPAPELPEEAQRSWQSAAGALLQGWVRELAATSARPPGPSWQGVTPLRPQRVATSRCAQFANVLGWVLYTRLRQREAAFRRRLAEEQQRQLEALAQTCACWPHVESAAKKEVVAATPDAAALCREQAAKATFVACSAGVLSWLRSLGNPSIPLEEKWAQLPTGELGYGPPLQPCTAAMLLGMLLRSPAQLSLRPADPGASCSNSMQTLYGLATESSGKLQQALAAAGQTFTPEGQRAFYRCPERAAQSELASCSWAHCS